MNYISYKHSAQAQVAENLNIIPDIITIKPVIQEIRYSKILEDSENPKVNVIKTDEAKLNNVTPTNVTFLDFRSNGCNGCAKNNPNKL